MFLFKLLSKRHRIQQSVVHILSDVQFIFNLISQHQPLNVIQLSITSESRCFNKGVAHIFFDQDITTLGFNMDNAQRIFPKSFKHLIFTADTQSFLEMFQDNALHATKIEWLEKGITIRFHYGIHYADMSLCDYITVEWA